MTAGDIPATGTTDASGVCLVTIRPTGRQTWAIQQVSTSMPTAPQTSTCAVYKNNVFITPMLNTGDAASGDPPVSISPSDVLQIKWVGATPGVLGNVYIIYDDGTS